MSGGRRLLAASFCVLAILAASPTPPAPAAPAGPWHHCGKLDRFGFPSVGAIQGRGIGCDAARQVGAWIYTRLHRQAWRGEEVQLPTAVGPIGQRRFSCSYRGVEDGDNFLYYAARCSSGPAVVRLRLGS